MAFDATRRIADDASRALYEQPYALGVILRAIHAQQAARSASNALRDARRYASRLGVDTAAGDALCTLVERSKVHHFLEGETIMRAGEPATKVYALLGGTVRVEREGIVTATLQKGQSFGEVALLADAPANMTVVADTGVSTLAVTRSALLRLTKQTPSLEALMRAVYHDRIIAQLLTPDDCFGTLDAEQRHRLAAGFIARDMPAGSEFVREGQPATGFFIIVAGQARVWRHGPNNKVIEVDTLGPGDFTGEVALLYEIPATVTVQALTQLTCFSLGRHPFHALMQGFPEQLRRVAEKARDRRVATTDHQDTVIDMPRLNFDGTAPTPPPAPNATMTCPRCAFDQPADTHCCACGAVIAYEREVSIYGMRIDPAMLTKRDPD